MLTQTAPVVSTVEMDRPVVRPSTIAECVEMKWDGTMFGYQWEDGKPHADMPDLMAAGHVESGEHHHYILVPVDLQEVIDAN